MKKFEDTKFGDIVVMRSEIAPTDGFGMFYHCTGKYVWSAFRMLPPKHSYYDEKRMTTPAKSYKIFAEALMPNHMERDWYKNSLCDSCQDTHYYYFDANEIAEAIQFACDLNNTTDIK